MGYGSGVLRSFYVYYFVRGLTTGITGTASLFIMRRTGVPQSVLLLARGLGLCLGPTLLTRPMSRIVWRGESQSCVAVTLLVKAACAYAIPRSDSPLLLCLCFLVLGLVVSSLDTMALYLVTRLIKEQGGAKLSLYDACYGIGGMVAPFLTIAAPSRTWDVLAVIDVGIFVCLAQRRLFKGKPRGWKEKVRGTGATEAFTAAGPGDDSEGLSPLPPRKPPVPSRVLHAGVAFTLISQIASTSVSAWGFTFSSVSLGLQDSAAALVPSAFYFAATAGRFMMAPMALRVPPSAIVQASVLVVLAGAVLLCLSTISAAAPVPGTGTVASDLYLQALLLLAMGLLGAGTCPHYSLTMVAMAKHGEIEAHQHGMYTTAVNLGITGGMVLPSLVYLPWLEVACAVGMALIMNSRVQDFPWRGKPHDAGQAAGR